MFLSTMSTIVMLSNICYTLSFSTILNEGALGIDDFRPLNKPPNVPDKPARLSIDEHEIQVKTIRTYLIIGYVILFCLVTYVCYSTKKNSAKHKPIPCVD